MTPGSVGLRPHRGVGFAAGAVVVHSVLVLVGLVGGSSLSVDPPEDFIPMAPSTALVFAILGLALVARRLVTVLVSRHIALKVVRSRGNQPAFRGSTPRSRESR